MPGTTPPSRRRPLEVAPFRAVRFAPDRVGDLAAVTSPPYDVVDATGVRALEEADPHNVVRLILPRDGADGSGHRYEHASRLLSDWVAQGVLVVDAQPGLYVYERAAADGGLQRGVVAAVEVTDPEDGAVLPHEEVMPGPVADRFELMRATGTNLEPILLVYAGAPGATRDVIAAQERRRPVLDVVTDAARHRLWRLQDADTVAAVAADLRPHTALIADGHHRYAAYRRLRAEAAGRSPDGDAGGWAYGLALLVDSAAYPLAVHAIHRAVSGLSLDQAVERSRSVFRVGPAPRELERLLERLAAAGTDGPAYAVGDGERWYLLDGVDLAGLRRPDAAGRRARLDSAVLHEVVLETLWGVADEQVSYHHDVAGAVARARATAGSAVLLNPPTTEDVLAVAAEGATMPRKTTSFGPKPRTGLVLRRVDGGAAG